MRVQGYQMPDTREYKIQCTGAKKYRYGSRLPGHYFKSSATGPTVLSFRP